MELPIPTSLVDRWVVLLQNRFINGDLSQYTVHFPPDLLTPEGIRLTAGGVGLSTGYQTHSNG